jgi:hypothetical protein
LAQFEEDGSETHLFSAIELLNRSKSIYERLGTIDFSAVLAEAFKCVDSLDVAAGLLACIVLRRDQLAQASH